MAKIETPEEFAKRYWLEPAYDDESLHGQLARMVEERDALIRADERQKAAERAVHCLNEFETDWIRSGGEIQAKHEAVLRTAIMAEPEEAHA